MRGGVPAALVALQRARWHLACMSPETRARLRIGIPLMLAAVCLIVAGWTSTLANGRSWLRSLSTCVATGSPSEPIAVSMRCSTSPHTLLLQKSYWSGPSTEATGTRAVASAGASVSSSDSPCSGLSVVPTRSR